MLTNNQIERLLEHTRRQLEELDESNESNYWYRKGFSTALKLVLHGDENSINDNPINKEKQCTRPLMKSISTLMHKIGMLRQ